MPNPSFKRSANGLGPPSAVVYLALVGPKPSSPA